MTGSIFPARLKKLMSAARLDVPTLAAKAGVSRQGLYRLVAGDRAPSWDTVQKLAKALGVSTEEFRSR